MRYLALVLSLLLATSADAADRRPARIGPGTWIVAATVGADADRVCFIANGERVVCAMPGPTPNGEATVNETTVQLEPPVTSAVVAQLTTTAIVEIRAIACRTTDGLELCSALSSDAFQLVPIQPPAPPTLLDTEAIRAALGEIGAAIEKIRLAIPEAR